MQLIKNKYPKQLILKTHIHTYSEHDCVCKLDVVDIDSRNEADQARNDIGVVHIYRFCYGLETIQQSLCVLVRKTVKKARKTSA